MLTVEGIEDSEGFSLKSRICGKAGWLGWVGEARVDGHGLGEQFVEFGW